MNDNKDTERRVYRHKRRIRNQIIAYISLVVIIAVLAVGGVFAAKYIVGRLKDGKPLEQPEESSNEFVESEEPITISDPEPETVEEEVNWLDEMVNACIAEMPIEDKVAGLFFITPEALTGVGTAVKAGDGTKEALGTYAVGGLVYFSQNIKSEEQLTEMIANTTLYTRYPLFFAVDEEGGKVSRVADSSIEVEKISPMAEIGATGDAQNAYEAGVTIGAYLKRLGFNLDFAPVADVLVNAENTTIGDRSFGTDAAIVGQMVPSFVTGIEEEGVSSCLKHFPGLGDTTEDTHNGMAVTERTLEEFQTVEFPVFKAGIDAGADFVMVSHVSAPALTGDNTPASLSGAVIGILRNDLGFDGIVITDALNMTAITDYYTSEEAAIKAIQGGADMLLMPEDFEAAYQGLLQAVQDGTISEERINESLRRIYRVKYADRME